MWFNKKTIIVGGSFVLVTLFGNGALWQWGQYQIDKERVQLETEKCNIDRVAAAMKLRENLNDLFYKITRVVAEHQDVLSAKSGGANKIGSFTVEQKLLLLNTELDQLIDDSRAAEASLAKLENRQPREINLQFRPPDRPSKIRLEGKW